MGAAEQLRHEGPAGAVEGREEQARVHVLGGLLAQRQAHGDVGFLDLMGDETDARILSAGGAFRHQGQDGRGVLYFRVPGAHHLGAAVVVGFVAVVGLRIMGGGDDDAAS